jgi:hypothetical protein
VEQAVKARVADLVWMTGSWIGAFGEQTLEETWSPPTGGTIACLVRLTGNGATGMVELILIEDVEDSVVFRVRQFLPGLVPRSPDAQLMELAEIGDRRVGFTATGDAIFRRLTYSRPTADEFVIDAETPAGDKIHLTLRPR